MCWVLLVTWYMCPASRIEGQGCCRIGSSQHCMLVSIRGVCHASSVCQSCWQGGTAYGDIAWTRIARDSQLVSQQVCLIWARSAKEFGVLIQRCCQGSSQNCNCMGNKFEPVKVPEDARSGMDMWNTPPYSNSSHSLQCVEDCNCATTYGMLRRQLEYKQPLLHACMPSPTSSNTLRAAEQCALSTSDTVL